MDLGGNRLPTNLISFTAPRIERLKCTSDKLQTFYWDNKTPTLGIRVTANGAKSYVFQSWFINKAIRITIGDVKTWSIPKAQAEARHFKVLTDQGIDPRNLIAETKAKAEAKKFTQVKAIDIWEQEFIQERKSKWGARQLANYQNVVRKGGGVITRGLKPGGSPIKQDGILRSLLSQPLSNITRDEVAIWLNKEIPKRPTWTRLAFSLLRAFIAWAKDNKKYKELVHSDACSRQELPKPNSKDDCLQKEQLSDWFSGVIKINNPVIGYYLQILLLTGARREELASLKWTDVDLKWKTMAVKDKVEGTRQIPITPYVGLLLNTIPRHNEFVFFSETSKSGRIQEPRKSHNNALDLLGLPHLSIHGLRRSFGTLAEWVECPSGISAQIMGHKPSALAEKHYRKRPIDMLRMWHTKIEKFILDQAGIPQPEESTKLLQVVKKK
jgi:integrase